MEPLSVIKLNDIKAWFEQEDKTVESLEVLDTFSDSEITVRVSFEDDTVSDWKIYFDDDSVVDAYHFNDVI